MTSIQDRIKVLNEQVRQLGSCPISNCKIHNPINFANTESINHVNVKLNKRGNDCDSEGFKFPAKGNNIRIVNITNSNTTLSTTHNKFVPLQNVPIEETSINTAPKIPPVMVCEANDVKD
ncbi:hypothetical protein CDAR_447071 [Caerostris darwini]|uniref:Reverse transcriptase domain-containing protein n=1 Tax=Caerostris darwini TaxID=1538125 RepID=A0AAV4P715_9ARAC|nr:hypothetical protein CDAR_447071 [Caerostris darwini]